jgi:hypothetical protein
VRWTMRGSGEICRALWRCDCRGLDGVVLCVLQQFFPVCELHFATLEHGRSFRVFENAHSGQTAVHPFGQKQALYEAKSFVRANLI